MYKITRIVNNNIVCSEDEKGRELILRGLGIGFGKKKNDLVEDDKVEKIYRISNHSASSKLETLLSSIPYEQIETSFSIIEYAKQVLPRTLSENIHITLTDHINFALQRHKEHMDLANPMLWEIRSFYPSEYQVALHALEMIEKKLGVSLSDDEAGFITLHLVNAELDTDMGNTVQITEMIQKIMEDLAEFCEKEIPAKSTYVERFITHLKFWGQRLLANQEEQEEDDPELYMMIFRKYPSEYVFACQVAEYVTELFGKSVSNSEKMYLTIHVKRIRISLSEE